VNIQRKPFSEETRERMRQSQTIANAKKAPMSEEHEDQIRRINKERVVTPETRENMRASRLAYIAKTECDR